MANGTIGDWIARIIVWAFYTTLGGLVGSLFTLLGILLYYEIGWQGYAGIVGGFTGLFVLVWAFERDSSRRYNKRQKKQYKQMYPVYKLDQKLDEDESLL